MSKEVFQNTDIKRRKIIHWSSAGLMALFLVSRTSHSALSIVSKFYEMKHDDLDNEFLDFHSSSAEILGVSVASLDPKLAYYYWTTLTSHSPTHKQLLLLSKELKKVKKAESNIKSLNELPEAIHDITKRLIQVWYTGVDTMDAQQAKRFVYEESLMFSLFLLLRNPPGTCGGTFGYWADKPARI